MQRYEVKGSLGQGSFGTVYKAERRGDKKTVAIKVISKLGRSVSQLKDLQQECKIQAALKHPNIIEMYEHFATKTELFVITEYAETDLHRYLAKMGGVLQEPQARPIVCDLVSALWYLHSKRILHRDLKPQNVLLTHEQRVKLCDFGLARNMAMSTTALTSIKGTPLYMAPELLAQKPYSFKADLWSLGCIAYEIVARRPPFNAKTIFDLVVLLKTTDVQWPANISNDFRSFLQCLLEKDDEYRAPWAQLISHPFVVGLLHEVKEPINKDSSTEDLTQMLGSFTLSDIEHDAPNYNKLREDSLVGLPDSDEEHLDLDFEDTLQGVVVPFVNESINCKAKQSSVVVANPTSAPDQPIADVVAPVRPAGNSPKKPLESREQNARSTLQLTSPNGIAGPAPRSNGAEQVVDNDSQSSPLENDEWLAFLNQTAQEIFDGEYESLKQPNLLNVIIAPLRNSKATPKVMKFVAQLLSLPFVLDQPAIITDAVKHAYLRTRLVPNLMFAAKLMLTSQGVGAVLNDSANSALSALTQQTARQLDELSDSELKTLNALFELICHLAQLNVQFLTQFCDATAVITANEVYASFISHASPNADAVRLKLNIITLLACVLRELPENAVLVERIVFQPCVKLAQLLQHPSAPLVRHRACMLLRLLGRFSLGGLQRIWNDELRGALIALTKQTTHHKLQLEATQTLEELSHFAHFS